MLYISNQLGHFYITVGNKYACGLPLVELLDLSLLHAC